MSRADLDLADLDDYLDSMTQDLTEASKALLARLTIEAPSDLSSESLFYRDGVSAARDIVIESLAAIEAEAVARARAEIEKATLDRLDFAMQPHDARIAAEAVKEWRNLAMLATALSHVTDKHKGKYHADCTAPLCDDYRRLAQADKPAAVTERRESGE